MKIKRTKTTDDREAALQAALATLQAKPVAQPVQTPVQKIKITYKPTPIRDMADQAARVLAKLPAKYLNRT